MTTSKSLTFHELLSLSTHDEFGEVLGLEREDAKHWRYAYLYGAGSGTAFFWMDLTDEASRDL